MVPRRAAAKYLLSAALVGAILLVVDPNPGYYLHLARGQLRLIVNSRPISELLGDPDLDPQSKTRLHFIAAVREYSRQRIGLVVGDQYTCFYNTGGRPVSWNVSASPPDRFEPHLWSFPIVGSVPYKGFFDLDRAHDEQAILLSKGLDVSLSPVSAYSTLGFFADPVLSSMLEYSDDALASLLLHELTHGTAFAPGHTDFNESLATFVGKTGSLDFLAEHYGAPGHQIDDIHRRRHDAQAFRGFVRELVSELEILYNSGRGREQILTERVSVFNRAKADYGSVRDTLLLSPSRYDGFLDWSVNNARLLSYRRYHDLDDFNALYGACKDDLRRLVEISRSCAQTESPRACLRDSTAELTANQDP